MKTAPLPIVAGLAASLALALPASAWDSEETYKSIQSTVSKLPGPLGSLPGGLVASIKPTHSSLTEEALGNVAGTYPEVKVPANRQALLDGANAEMHELPNTEGTFRKTLRPYYVSLNARYGIDTERLRVLHGGTNEGCTDMPGWWREAEAAFAAGNPKRAFFFTGILLHMIQDMGVPAHAHKLKHQGNATEFDTVEAVATFTPYDLKLLSTYQFENGVTFGFPPTVSYSAISFPVAGRTDPRLPSPAGYYDWAASWTRTDVPSYTSVKTTFLFSPYGTWKDRIQLIANRRLRSMKASEWALASACRAFFHR